jgi:dUTP pyrophosphatase
VVKVVKRLEEAVVPELATLGSAGFDLASSERVELNTGTRAVIDTGISLEIPPGYEGQVRPRSGLAIKYGLTVLNAPGTIDSDYRGPVKVILHNTGPKYLVEAGDRIAQLVIQKVPKVKFESVEVLSETERGSGGFGSTGR